MLQLQQEFYSHVLEHKSYLTESSGRETFLMNKKFLGCSDEELILMMKDGESDAEFELLLRYGRKAKMLAAKYYSQYKRVINCDIEDLTNASLNAVFIAARSFTKMKGFNSYWGKIARNEIFDLIKTNSDDFMSNFNFSFVKLDDSTYEGKYFAKDDTTEDDVFHELVTLVRSPKLKIDSVAADAFILSLMGYQTNDIAKKLGLTYRQTQYKINIVKEKLEKIVK